jgi:hypothetical protein
MKLIVTDSNEGIWNDMCEWLNENVSNVLEADHRYIDDSDKIELTFMYEADAIMFRLKFGV